MIQCKILLSYQSQFVLHDHYTYHDIDNLPGFNLIHLNLIIPDKIHEYLKKRLLTMIDRI